MSFSSQRWPLRSLSLFRMGYWRRLTPYLALCVASPIAANIPPPPPQKLKEDFSFTCRMLSDQRAATNLSISIRYEPITGKYDFYRTAYWWSISGDDDRFPSNKTAKYMRSLELDQPTSGLFFPVADGWTYYYSLFYGAEDRYPSSYYVPDHLIVRRKRTDETPAVSQLVGIGACTLTSTDST